MNIHPMLLTEIAKQRQQSMLDDAKRWPRAVKTRRRVYQQSPKD